jgi:trigger factor
MPEIVLGEYKGVEAPKELSEPTDQEVDSQVDRLRNEFAELRPISGRPAQSGDFVNVDLNATLDGQPVENLQASDFVFDLGGGRMFPEVEEQILGMNGGDEKAFPLTLP